MLREDELFVVEALCAEMSCTWNEGEDPPDAYLSYDGTNIAVEISTLTQHVMNNLGEAIPRLSQDAGVIRLCDELDEELGKSISNGHYVILTIHSPIKKIRKFKELLKQQIMASIKQGSESDEIVIIQGNEIRLHVVQGELPSGKRIVGVVANRNSSANISENSEFILRQRIGEKTKTCANIEHRPLWLALYNDYWLADIGSYQQALKNISMEHPFERIFLIDGRKKVYKINEI